MPEEITEILTSTPVRVGVMFLIVSAIMSYLASVYWVYQDINRRTANPVLQGLSIAVSLLPFFGVVVYLFIRPPLTILERKIQKLDAIILRKIAQGELPLSAYRDVSNAPLEQKNQLLQAHKTPSIARPITTSNSSHLANKAPSHTSSSPEKKNQPDETTNMDEKLDKDEIQPIKLTRKKPTNTHKKKTSSSS